MRIKRGPDPGPYSDHRQYKPHLRPLFRCRCAYCLTPDEQLGGEDLMTVDHFKPERRFPKLRLSWPNLYYACHACNSHYKKDHPTAEEEANGKRFVDPCEEDPDDHFRLVCDPDTGERCRVRGLSSAAEYVVFRLKFNQRKSLRDFWRSLHREESRLLRRETEIRHRLEDCARLVKRRGPNAELATSPIRLRVTVERELGEIEGVRSNRPFPID